MVITSKCMLVCLMWIKFIYELYRNIRGNSFVLDVRIQRAVSPFIEVAHGNMCDLPESEFLTSRFSQSFASGSFFFSATHGLELFDSSALNKCSNMIYFHYATVENALLLANLKEYSMAISKLISLKRLCCSFKDITIYINFFSKSSRCFRQCCIGYVS